MRIAVGGASGMLGSRLVKALEQRGDEVVRLVRRPAVGTSERTWDPLAGTIESPGLSDVDAVVNLAGASIAGGRWTSKRMRLLTNSRLGTTNTVVNALHEQSSEGQCRTFLSASAIGFYGYDLGDQVLTESSPQGSGFLADLCEAWESTAAPAKQMGVRVTYLRTANVLAPEGGIAKLLRAPFKLGLGGRTGSGRQWFSWITAEDHVRAMMWLLDNPVPGPVNLAAPQPVRNEVFARQFAQTLRRPAIVPFPKCLAALFLTTRMVDETIGAGQRVIPRALQRSQFVFNHATLRSALLWLNNT